MTTPTEAELRAIVEIVGDLLTADIRKLIAISMEMRGHDEDVDRLADRVDRIVRGWRPVLERAEALKLTGMLDDTVPDGIVEDV